MATSVDSSELRSAKSTFPWYRVGDAGIAAIFARTPAAVRGHAHYLLRLNNALRRSVTMRWARARSRWMPQDGLVRLAPGTRPMLESQRLGARPYSLSALQKFATCPYQFLLSAIYRLEPNDDARAIAELLIACSSA